MAAWSHCVRWAITNVLRRRHVLAGAAASTLPLFGARAARPPRLGALSGPQAELLGFAMGLLPAPDRPRIIVSDDAAFLMRGLTDGTLDASASHSAPELADSALSAGFATVTLPMGVYAGRRRSLAELRDGDRIILPRDDADHDRARVLLYNVGLLYAHEDDGLAADFSNIVNPRKFILDRGEPAPAQSAAVYVLPFKAAIQARLKPGGDAMALEDGKTPYTQVCAVRAADLHAPWLATLARAFQSRDMRRRIFAAYGDSVETAW